MQVIGETIMNVNMVVFCFEGDDNQISKNRYKPI